MLKAPIPEGEKDTSDQGVQNYGKHTPLGLHIDIPRVAPDSSLDMAGAIRLDAFHPQERLLYVPKAPAKALAAGIWTVCPEEKDAWMVTAVYGQHEDADLGKHVQMLYLPQEIESVLRDAGVVDLADIAAVRYTTTRLTQGPVLVLTGDTSMLYFTMMQADANEIVSVRAPDGALYIGDALDASNHCFKKLIRKKEIKMKGLTNYVAKNTKPVAPAQTPNVAEADPQETDVAEAVNAPIGNVVVTPAPEKPAKKAKPAPAPVAEPEPLDGPEAGDVVDDVPVDEELAQPEPPAAFIPQMATEESLKKPLPEVTVTTATTAEEPPKRRRAAAKKAAGALVETVKAITAELGADIDDIPAEKFDETIEELRAIRDLQIAAARRAANLACGLAKMSKAALDMYAAVKNFVK